MWHRDRVVHLVLLFSASLLSATYGAFTGAEPHLDVSLSPMKVQGEVVSIGAEYVVVKTSTATYRLNKKTARLHATVGDKVTLWVTSRHAVIDHQRQDTGRRHRFMTGTLLDAASLQQINLWTPEGDRSYSLAKHAPGIKQFPEGTMVTVEIDEAGAVIDVHPVETEMAACDKRHHCKVMLHGTVMKIEDRMIFIKTPVVEYEIQADIAPPGTAVGDEMTLWVNENNVVLNYYRAGALSHRRFVTGTLRYADGGRSQVRFWTPEGDRTFLLVQTEKTARLREGRPITLEISEAGTVLDLWQTS